MADIINFGKYKETKEIDSYQSAEEEKLCLACPECESQVFAIFLDNTIQCIGCEVLIGLEFEE